ncbi:uncharacterized protein EDB93DRAFT_1175384 [Suillus bovinus]|uniref:uncharacterized protein n=1 Tax=Suillus bovinus TaxID=48563 RepID=UPI001B878FAE|nr:uncharacterized protein EDB93DRAFT_1175384 [Suillus bovinus]KAG2132917.1 hypothetical protein EDB93DRAFT_1175384 [Suillus bovinus]
MKFQISWSPSSSNDNMQTADSDINFSKAVSDIIDTLQNIPRSQTTITNLENPYSRATVPNPNHAIERQQQLDTILHEISDLQTVMNKIQNLYGQLVEKKDEIIESINLHGRLGSPALWRLPPEILSHIFVYCLPEDEYLAPASRLAPVLLTRICRRWREVVVGMPRLWCSLRLEAEHDDWHQRASCYDAWLKRTLGRPLSLALHFKYSNGTRRVQRLLQPYSHQIHSLYIDFHGVDDSAFSFNFCPALQELSVVGHTAAVAQPISRLSSTLTNLKFPGMWWFDIELLSSFAPVWANLTEVEIYVDKQDAFIHLLQLCPNLSSLKTGIVVSQIQALEPFTHATLESLHLCGGGRIFGNPLSGVFSALSLPNLRVLDVWNTLMWPHEEFKAFLAQSERPLENLNFGALAITTEEQRAEYVSVVPFLKVVVDPNLV